MTQVLVIGATGGLGRSLVQELRSKDYQVDSWSSQDWDMNYPNDIFQKDISGFDLVINAAGHSQGTYLGFVGNAWNNQISQIMVNYASNLSLLKHYSQSRSHGKYVWISTSLLGGSRPFHSVYASTKAASKFAIDLVRQECAHIRVLEVRVGPTRTNFRSRNFLGTKTDDHINQSYDQDTALDPKKVAADISIAIERDLREIHIV